MERDRFLARLSASLAEARPRANRAHPAVVCDEVVPAVYRRSLEDLPLAFCEAATREGACVRRVTGPPGVGELLAEVVRSHGVRTAVLSGDPETQGVARELQALGVRVLPWDGPHAAAEADLGVTGAVCAIAATGSIVVAADRAGGRTASLLPPVHLALVPEQALVATTAGLWREMEGFFPRGLPSQVVVITGPSRTGDIELILTRGVHGPGHLWIGILGAGGPDRSMG